MGLLHELEPGLQDVKDVLSPPPPCLCPVPSRGQQDREHFVLSEGRILLKSVSPLEPRGHLSVDLAPSPRLWLYR